MKRYSPHALAPFAASILEALGTRADDAVTVAEHLVDSHLVGHDSHGLIRLRQYRDHVRDGKVSPGAETEALIDTPTTALLDGHFGWGQVIAKRATDLAIEKASRYRVAAVSVRNCYHIGRVGVYPELAARQGFIGQLWCNVHGVCRVAPWGGTDARMSTNPVAIAIPTRDEPLLVDITTSVVAEGKVRVAKNAGKEIPEGWVLDRQGRPTTDPAKLYDNGTLLPLGGREGHKGYGLSVIVDLLGGALSGAGCGTLTNLVGNGLFLQVTDPTAFAPREEFLDRVEEFVAYLRSSDTKEGVDAILLPGEPERRTREERTQTGIAIDASTVAQLTELAAELDVDASALLSPDGEET